MTPPTTHSQRVQAVSGARKAPPSLRPRGLFNQLKFHCPSGHEYNLCNVRVTPRGWRSCRRCNAIRMKERRKALFGGIS